MESLSRLPHQFKLGVGGEEEILKDYYTIGESARLLKFLKLNGVPKIADCLTEYDFHKLLMVHCSTKPLHFLDITFDQRSDFKQALFSLLYPDEHKIELTASVVEWRIQILKTYKMI